MTKYLFICDVAQVPHPVFGTLNYPAIRDYAPERVVWVISPAHGVVVGAADLTAQQASVAQADPRIAVIAFANLDRRVSQLTAAVQTRLQQAATRYGVTLDQDYTIRQILRFAIARFADDSVDDLLARLRNEWGVQ